VLLPLLVEIQTPFSPNPTISAALLPVVSATRRTCRSMVHPPLLRLKFLTTVTGWKLKALRMMTTPFVPKPTTSAMPGEAVGTGIMVGE